MLSQTSVSFSSTKPDKIPSSQRIMLIFCNYLLLITFFGCFDTNQSWKLIRIPCGSFVFIVLVFFEGGFLHVHIVYTRQMKLEEEKEKKNYCLRVCVRVKFFLLLFSSHWKPFLICAFIQNEGSRFKSGSMVAVCRTIRKQVKKKFLVITNLRNKLHINE